MIIYCNCTHSQVIPDRVKVDLREKLTEAGIEFEAVPDLCELSARRDPALQRWADAERIKIIACFERAVKWLFHAAGAPLPPGRAEFLNMRSDSVESILTSLSEYKGSAVEHQMIKLDKTSDWVPWFPVIDYERCANCKQCLNFCIFGVYGLSAEEQVQVQKPANCKTNCPACARVCPQKAIIFPKYTESPFNGDRVEEESREGAKTGVKLSELLGGDIHDILGQRGKGQIALQKDTIGHEAISRLAKLKNSLDIPQEVIDSLSIGQMTPSSQTSNTQNCPNAQSTKCNRECKGGR